MEHDHKVVLSMRQMHECWACLRDKCEYVKLTLGDEPTIDDLRIARRHALACDTCAIAVAEFYENQLEEH